MRTLLFPNGWLSAEGESLALPWARALLMWVWPAACRIAAHVRTHTYTNTNVWAHDICMYICTGSEVAFEPILKFLFNDFYDCLPSLKMMHMFIAIYIYMYKMYVSMYVCVKESFYARACVYVRAERQQLAVNKNERVAVTTSSSSSPSLSLFLLLLLSLSSQSSDVCQEGSSSTWHKVSAETKLKSLNSLLSHMLQCNYEPVAFREDYKRWSSFYLYTCM